MSSNLSLQVKVGTFVSQRNQNVAQFGGQHKFIGKSNESKCVFGFLTQFSRRNGALKTFGKQNNVYYYSAPDQSPKVSQGSEVSAKSQYVVSD
ncbi:unnamed protein product [Diabrotica balteata]|uniref:Uncharacterized protein n=1 Tax=Diabrotica balteata TaxID=107213 RepID=A0A9N9X8H7_DIABA|nr:unnamed protein product [Diabrotica balteata]